MPILHQIAKIAVAAFCNALAAPSGQGASLDAAEPALAWLQHLATGTRGEPLNRVFKFLAEELRDGPKLRVPAMGLPPMSDARLARLGMQLALTAREFAAQRGGGPAEV
ncbi:MAG: hypothetical protein HY706_21145 [Candidatus Hydrogenedentes bacterium]|nr:hypothetical protein [Candidatus Hydrogenedentota bacterium]